MDLDELKEKLQRLHESLDDTKEPGEKINRPYSPSGGWARVPYNFQENWTPTKTKRLAFNVIRDIADLEDHIKSALRKLNHDTDLVTRTIKENLELALIIDLANRDKHSAHNRKTWSGKAPRLTNVKRVVHAQGRVRPGQSLKVGLDFTPAGIEGFGDSVGVVINGDIIGKGGERLTDLVYTQDKAIEAWESLLSKLGIAYRRW